MAIYYNPNGNAEVWDKKPKGYMTPEQWKEKHPDPVTYYNVKGETVPIIPGEKIPDGYMTEAEYHDTPEYLEVLKQMRVAEIDRNTERIRDRDGMNYAGEKFSMSLQAQANWTKLALGIVGGIIQFPYTGVQTIDDKWFPLETKEAGMGFVLATAGYENDPSSPVRQGRDLKVLVATAQTKEELEAIKDERE